MSALYSLTATVLLLLRFEFSEAISCLVIRPGFGLVSEPCPRLAVACRIRIEADHIVWYEYSKLYDRNRLVCVLPDEYNTKEQKTGCVKKPSGALRCWCAGQSNCNNPASSRDLYFAFQSGDADEMRAVAEEIESGDFSDYESFDAETNLHEEDVAGRGKPDQDGQVPITKVQIASRPKLETTTTKVAMKTSSTLPSDSLKPSNTEAVPPVFTSHEKARKLPADSDSDEYEKTKYEVEAEMKEEERRNKEFLEDEQKELRDDDAAAESRELADLQADQRKSEELDRKSFKEHMDRARIDQQKYLEQQKEAQTTEMSHELPRDLVDTEEPEQFDDPDQDMFPFLDQNSSHQLCISLSLLLFCFLFSFIN